MNNLKETQKRSNIEKKKRGWKFEDTRKNCKKEIA